MNKLTVLSVVFCVLMAMLLALPKATLGGPTIEVYTDKAVYEPGDTIEVSLSCSNDGEAILVSIYFGFFAEDGAVYAFGPGGWSESFRPWMGQWMLPHDFESGRLPLFWYDVPRMMPTILDPGRYNFAALLTRAGTAEWVSDLSIAPFWYVEEGSDIHGGSITEDTLLSGDIYLTSDLIIEEGAVLTILPPARIRSARDVGITVHGGLIAEGDVQDSIIFEGLEPYQDWNNITFGMSADDEQCRIVRCLIRGGSGKLAEMPWYEYRWGGAVFCYESSPHIESNTITGNWAEVGGGIASYNGSPTIIENVIIGNSTVWAFGSGIHCDGGAPTITDNTITGNWAQEGGNDYAAGIDCEEGTPTILNNTISANSGGGLICGNCTATISLNTIRSNTKHGILCGESQVTISDNTILRNQGGISCYEGQFTITDNIISGNHAPSYSGGGIDLTDCSATVSGNIISENRADYGGGIRCSSTTNAMIAGDGKRSSLASGSGLLQNGLITVFNNQIVGNSADWGGAIYNSSRIALSIMNNTIANNSAYECGGIYRDEDAHASMTIVDCILWGNGDDLFGCNPYDCSITYCCIEDMDEGEGNIHDNPLFVTGPLGDYYLHLDSPCIDAGSRSAADAGLSDHTTQADGTLDSGIVDMGYHYPIP